MEVYVWTLLAFVALGFLGKTYWDVFLAWRAYERASAQPNATDIVVPPRAASSLHAPSGFVNLLAKGTPC